MTESWSLKRHTGVPTLELLSCLLLQDLETFFCKYLGVKSTTVDDLKVCSSSAPQHAVTAALQTR
jgi:hypothetical protein